MTCPLTDRQTDVRTDRKSDYCGILSGCSGLFPSIYSIIKDRSKNEKKLKDTIFRYSHTVKQIHKRTHSYTYIQSKNKGNIFLPSSFLFAILVSLIHTSWPLNARHMGYWDHLMGSPMYMRVWSTWLHEECWINIEYVCVHLTALHQTWIAR